MRLAIAGTFMIVLAASLPACVSVEPDDAAERALAGATLGTALGVGIGATFAINPAIGAVVGAETGATLGAAAGVMTAQPAVSYEPIAPPSAAVVPAFYDTWAPGYHVPPIDSQTPPPPRSG